MTTRPDINGEAIIRATITDDDFFFPFVYSPAVRVGMFYWCRRFLRTRFFLLGSTRILPNLNYMTLNVWVVNDLIILFRKT